MRWHLRHQDSQQQRGHGLVVVHQPEEDAVGAASDVDLTHQLQTLPAESRPLAQTPKGCSSNTSSVDIIVTAALEEHSSSHASLLKKRPDVSRWSFDLSVKSAAECGAPTS